MILTGAHGPAFITGHARQRWVERIGDPTSLMAVFERAVPVEVGQWATTKKRLLADLSTDALFILIPAESRHRPQALWVVVTVKRYAVETKSVVEQRRHAISRHTATKRRPHRREMSVGDATPETTGGEAAGVGSGRIDTRPAPARYRRRDFGRRALPPDE